VTLNLSTGVYFGENASTSMESDTLSNITVVDCVFTGFADDMLFRGASNCTIYSNSFLFPLGRDSGSWTNQYPNVGILVQYVDGTSFLPGEFSVYSNTFNDLSGTTALSNLVSKGMADGFLATTVDGLNCYRNNITNNGAEGIYAGVIPGSAPVNSCYIFNNTITKDISLASGTGIRCDLPGSQVYSNFVLNSSFGLALGTPTNGYSATNMSFYSNNVTVASSVLPYFGWAFSINVWPYTGCPCYSNKFYSNTFTLNWSNVVVSPLGSYPFPYNVGIASSGGGSNYFTNNTFTVSASNTNNSYYGIALNAMFLDPNFGNIANNMFTNGWAGDGVYAENYPITGATTLPNTDTPSVIEASVASNNSFH
jgi:hypothetical protein